MQEQVLLYRRAPFYFSLVFLTALVGFYPSYFSKLGKVDVIHHFHGVMATAWMIMLIIQGWLMRQRNFSSHRAVGKLSLIIVPLFIISGLLVVYTMLSARNGFNQTYGARLAFIDLTTIMYFFVAYVLAIVNRRNIQLHARYMASTAILVLPPALARVLGSFVPGITSFDAAFHWSFLITEIIIVALIIDDARSNKTRIPYLVLLVFIILQQASFLVIPHIDWWNRLAGTL